MSVKGLIVKLTLEKYLWQGIHYDKLVSGSDVHFIHYCVYVLSFTLIWSGEPVFGSPIFSRF